MKVVLLEVKRYSFFAAKRLGRYYVVLDKILTSPCFQIKFNRFRYEGLAVGLLPIIKMITLN
jgi:hypothetical protein